METNTLTLKNSSDFFAGTNDTITLVGVQTNHVSFEASLGRHCVNNNDTELLLQNRVNINASVNLLFAAGYKLNFDVTYSCKPIDQIIGSRTSMEELVEGLNDGDFAFLALELDGVTPQDNTLANNVQMQANSMEIAETAERLYLGSIGDESDEGVTLELSEHDAFYAAVTLTDVLNDRHGYENTGFTAELLSELKAAIKKSALETLEQPYSEM